MSREAQGWWRLWYVYSVDKLRSSAAENKTSSYSVGYTFCYRDAAWWRLVELQPINGRRSKTCHCFGGGGGVCVGRVGIGRLRCITDLCWGRQNKKAKLKPIKQTYVVVYNQLLDKYELHRNITRQPSPNGDHATRFWPLSGSGSRHLWLLKNNAEQMNCSMKWVDLTNIALTLSKHVKTREA